MEVFYRYIFLLLTLSAVFGVGAQNGDILEVFPVDRIRWFLRELEDANITVSARVLSEYVCISCVRVFRSMVRVLSA